MAAENNLTYRQKAFLDKLLDLYREIQTPVHYNVIARKLGLCSSTVYDMLRVLEKKGMVNSHYKLPKEDTGPGRASILFVPADRAMEKFPPEKAAAGDQDEWDRVKTGIMTTLQQGAKSGYEKVYKSPLQKAGSVESPLESCARIVTGLLISLKQSRYEFSDNSSVFAMLKSSASRLNMSSVAGLITGLAIKDRKASKQPANYREHLNKFTTYLQEMSDENVRLLHQFTIDVWHVLGNDAAY